MNKKLLHAFALFTPLLVSVSSVQAVNWANLGTDMNTATNWSGALTTGGSADFINAASVQPNLSSSLSVFVLRFNATGATGYSLTSTGGAQLTLTATSTGASSAIYDNSTSGVNIIAAPLVLGAAANSTQTATIANVTAITGAISSTSANVTFSKANLGTLFLLGANTFSGNLSITQGTVIADTLGNQSESSSIGAGSKVTLGTSSASTLVYTGGSKTTDRLLDLGGTTAGGTLDQSGTGALKFTSGVTASGAGAKTLVLQGSTSGTGEIAGAIQNSTSATSLTKQGSGTWTLSANNSFTGAVNVNEGRLVLDYGTNTNVLGGSNALTLRGGVLEFKGKNSGVSSQTVGGITIPAVSAADWARLTTVKLNENGGGGFNLTTGAVTATTMGGTVFDLYNSSNSSVKIGTAITGDSNTNAGILIRTAAGVYDFAVNGGNTANSLSARGATAAITANGDSTKDYLVTNNASVGSGPSNSASASTRTLRIAPTLNNQTLTINNVSATAGGGAGGLTMAAGGLIYDGGSNNFTIAANGSTDASLRAANNGTALSIYHMGTGTLTIGPRVYLGYDSNGSTPLTNSLLFAGVGGLVDLQGGMNTQQNTLSVTAVSGVTLRVSGATRALNLSNTATGVGSMYLDVGDGGIIEAVNGNITRNLSLTVGGGALQMSGDAGFSAYGGSRSVQLNNGTSSVTWGSGGFVTGALVLSSNFSDSTIDFQNGINLGTVQRVVRVNNGSAAVDAILTGALTSAYGGGLIKEGAGTLTLNGTNTYVGATTVNAGTLALSGSGTLGTSTITIAGGTLDMGGKSLTNTFGSLTGGTLANGTLTNNGSNFDLQGGTVSASLAGTHGINKTTSSTVTLSGNNTYSGATTISAGTLEIASAGRLGGGSYSQNITNNGALIYSGSTSQTLSGVISGSGALTQNNTASTLTLSGNNTYTGTTTINAGTLEIASTGRLGGGSYAQNISNNGTIIYSGTTNQTLSGIISGSGALTQNNSASTLTLSGTSTYNGATTVNAGTLLLLGSVASSAVTVNNGTLIGNGTTGAITIASGASINPGVGVGSINTGGVTLNGGGTYNWQLLNASGAAGSGWDLISSTAALTIGANATNRFTINISTVQNQAGTAGSASGFVNSQDYTWRLAEFGSAISGFDPNFFTLDSTGFLNPLSGSFSLNATGNFLNLLYTTTLASYSYTAGTGNWSTATNWTPSGTPQTTSAITINGTGGTSTNDLLGTVQSLAIASAAGSYTIAGSGNGSTITLNGGITNSSSNNQTISMGIALGADQTFQADAGNLLLSGALGTSNRTLTVTGAGNVSISNTIDGNGAIVKNGAGTLTLNGNNTYTGATTVNAGTLEIASAGRLGAGSYSADITNNSTFIYSGANNQTLAGVISGSGALTQNNTAGTLILSGANTYTGATTINAGTLQIGGGSTTGSLATTSSLANNGTLTFNRSNTITQNTDFASVVSGTGNLIQAGTGNLILTGANTYTGATTINAGTLQIGAGSTTGSLATTSSLTNNGTLAFNRSNTITQNTDFASVVSGTGNLIQAGTGNLILTGANTYTGATTINVGTLEIASAGRLGAGSYSGNITNNGTFIYSGANNQALAGVISGSGALTQNNTAGTLILTGNNTYTGATTINVGTLEIASAGRLGAGSYSAGITNNGTFIYSGANNQTLAGVISGSGALTQNNTASTLILSANNTYTGGTTIAAGTLQIGGGSTSTSGMVAGNIVNNGALVFSRNNAMTYSGNISGNGSLTLGGGSSSSLTLSGNNSYTGGTTIANGGGGGFGLALGAHNALGTGALTLGNGSTQGRLTMAGYNQTITGLAMTSGAVALIDSGATIGGAVSTLTINIASGNTSISTSTFTFRDGSSGKLALLKTGGGTLDFSVLSPSNSGYSGGLTVNGGTFSYNSTATTAALGNSTAGGTITLGGGTLNYTGSTAQSITNNITLTGATTSTLNNANSTITVSGTISGSGNLTKSGAGTLTLSAANTYNGTTTVSAGTLTTSAADRISDSSAVTVQAGSTFQIGGSETVGSIAGAGNYSIAGFTLTAGGDNTSTTVSGNITGASGALIKTGSATLTLTGSNSYSGVTTISAGTLQIGNGGINGSLSASSSIVNNGALAFNRSDTITQGTDFNTVISGTGSLIQAGTGTLALNGTNSYTGATTISAGNLSISSVSALTNTSGVNLANATTLIYNGGLATLNRDISVTGATGSTGTIRNSGTGLLTLSGALSKNGTTLTLAGGSNGITVSGVISGSAANSDLVIDGGTTTLENANTYNGPTFLINGATLNANAVGALPTATLSAVTINGSSTLALGASQSVASLSGTSGSSVNLNANTLTINGSAATTYSGGISGTGNLVKNGSGTQTLAGATTFTGNTTVNSGTLKADAANALANTSQVVLNNGGSFLVTAENAVNDDAAIHLNGGRMAMSGNFNETVGALTLSANSTLDFSGFVGTLRFGSIASWAAGANLAIWNWSGRTEYGTNYGTYPNSSNLVFTNNSTLSSNLANISFYSDSGTTSIGSGFERGFSGGGTEIIAVPETETYFYAVALLAGVVIQYLRRRAKRKTLEGQPPA